MSRYQVLEGNQSIAIDSVYFRCAILLLLLLLTLSIACLPAQVHDLMMYIEASRSIEGEGGQELREASLLPSPEAPKKQQTGKRSSRKG